MNLGALGSFAGGIAGGYQDDQAAYARNKRNIAASGLDVARAGAITGEEGRAVQKNKADREGLQNAYQIFNDKLGAGHPTTKMIKSLLPPESFDAKGNLIPLPGDSDASAPRVAPPLGAPTGGASRGTASQSDASMGDNQPQVSP